MPTTLTLRLEEGRPLTNAEVDNNFISLRDNKLELSGGTMTGTLILAGGSTTSAPLRFNNTASALLSAVVKGALEYDSAGQKLYFTPASTRREIAYVDSLTAGWSTPRTITLAGDVTGSTTGVDGQSNILINTTIAPNSITLGNDTTGDYVQSITGGTGISVTGTAGEGAQLTVTNSAPDQIVGLTGAGSVSVSGTYPNFTITGAAGATYTGGTGVSINGSNQISIGQSVGTGDNVRFNNLGVGVAAPTSPIVGRILAADDVIAYTTSDERLKMDIENIPFALDKVRELRGVQFNWNPELLDVHGYEGKDVGLIAQEVLSILPEAVTTRENGFMAVKYEKVIGLLIEAIKELDAKVCKCTCSKH